MSTNYLEYRNQLLELTKQLGGKIPTTMGPFAQLHKNALASGVLASKYKELMSLAISIAGRCGGCIAFHTHDALKAGATREEVQETIGVAVMMGGGPSVVYGCEALDALNQFQV